MPLTFRQWAKGSFERFAYIERTFSPLNTGVKLVSGHIQSDNKALLDNAVGRTHIVSGANFNDLALGERHEGYSLQLSLANGEGDKGDAS